MKTIFHLFITFFASLLLSNTYGQKVTADKVWASPDILYTSESVCYNDQNQSLYVSCINGNPVEKDGNGFISIVDITGAIIFHEWAQGLHAPKGMAILNRSLFVTDIDRVVEIELETGEILREYPVMEAKFLNDIAVDPEENVYITDYTENKIYRIRDGGIGLWFEDESVQTPNGLYFENGELLVGTKNGIFAIRVEDKRIWHAVKDTGGIDGLKSFGSGQYIISDWMGKVQIVGPSIDPVVLINTTDQGMNAADFEYIAERDLLIIPTFSDNRIVAYELLMDEKDD